MQATRRTRNARDLNPNQCQPSGLITLLNACLNWWPAAFLLLLSILSAGCQKSESPPGNKPSAEDARTLIEQKLSRESQSLLALSFFEKADGIMREIDGVQVYDLDFAAEFEALENCLWQKGHFEWDGGFRAQTGSLGAGWGGVANRGAGNTECRKGDKQAFAGSIRFEKSEKGWRSKGLLGLKLVGGKTPAAASLSSDESSAEPSPPASSATKGVDRPAADTADTSGPVPSVAGAVDSEAKSGTSGDDPASEIDFDKYAGFADLGAKDQQAVRRLVADLEAADQLWKSLADDLPEVSNSAQFAAVVNRMVAFGEEQAESGSVLAEKASPLGADVDALAQQIAGAIYPELDANSSKCRQLLNQKLARFGSDPAVKTAFAKMGNGPRQTTSEAAMPDPTTADAADQSPTRPDSIDDDAGFNFEQFPSYTSLNKADQQSFRRMAGPEAETVTFTDRYWKMLAAQLPGISTPGEFADLLNTTTEMLEKLLERSRALKEEGFEPSPAVLEAYKQASLSFPDIKANMSKAQPLMNRNQARFGNAPAVREAMTRMSRARPRSGE
jgi:hypothetical protein